MTTQVKQFYKGNLYTLTIRGNDLAYAHDEEGYVVYNPSLLHALALVWKNLF
jgi:hypothetical protein